MMTSNNASQDTCHKCDILQDEIKTLRALGMPWRKISAIYHHIPAGSLQSWIEGKRDLADKHKVKLDIPVKIPTVPCSTCGVVHVRKTCPNKQPKQRKRYPRFYAYWFEKEG